MKAIGRFAQRQFVSTGKYPKTFKKLLVANRGEIARRVQSTCKKMGIQTVAVYSDADRHAMFVKEADEAFRLGPAPSKESYLNMDLIIDACKKSGADSVHPGYGFLSENSVFMGKLRDNNITFIGPPDYAIHAMGDKIESKKTAKAAKVNTIPGYMGEVMDANHAKKIANEIGYPVMVKASAGGGGKGIRIAWNDAETDVNFRLCKDEAINSFGDGRLLIEKYIVEPRHIEFQILGDKHGNYVYMPERECSVQRRNQKVIEEAPSTAMDPETRHKMGTQACMMAKAVGYYTTGTCEFMLDKFKKFFFLEMNTRLQVEHPITEMITGIDLVEQMILIAAGHKLQFTQNDIKINGHSMEYRLYAEDPAKKFLPSIGFLTKYREPKTQTNVRIDTGVQEGSEISMFYDPMISKLIVWGKDRPAAIQLLNKAIDEFVVRGVNHNAGFCKTIINHPRFLDGNYNTGFIPNFYKDGYNGEVMTPYDHRLLAITAYKMKQQSYANAKLTDSKMPFTNEHLKTLYCQIDNNVYKVCQCSDTGKYHIKAVEGKSEETTLDSFKINEYSLDYGQLIEMKIENNKGEIEDKIIQYMETINNMTYRLFYRGSKVDVKVYDETEYKYKRFIPIPVKVDMSKRVIAPMPGVVISLAVKPGDSVVDGQEICVLEAMKMQNVIKCEKDGKIKAVLCKTKQSVGVDDLLVELE